MKNIPDKLYLQIGLEDNGEECEDFNELDTENITWSTGKVFNDDIEYTKSSRTEEIAIWFTLWKYNNHWEFFAQEDDVVYYKNMDTDEPKTDKELFSDYLEYLKTL